jgi:hypothetical protein
MKCPHCLENFFAQWNYQDCHWQGSVAIEPGGHHEKWTVATTRCAACQRIVIHLQNRYHDTGGTIKDRLIQPKGISRAPLPQQVPRQYAEDYIEACTVLADSAKASAALSRRCLQSLLRGEGKVAKSDLYKEIQEVIESKSLPADLAESLDNVRHIGNFAAHPEKSIHSGEVIDVEPGEAEWNLEVIEELFDFYFVRPARLAARRDALNKKLGDAGKRPMKS